jgi:acetylornithine deacetylase/succinyl-diaminopimelate desuccinylase-like protein
VAAWILGVLCLFGAVGASDLDKDELTAQTVRLLQRYLRIDTVNPPGNEWRAVDFFAEILAAEGIAFETVEAAPGRGNLWARLPGGDEPALLLLHHSDVVPADERYWKHGPLSGALDDGYVYGRGAIDTKGLGILHLQAFLSLHRRGAPLRRDVLFMVTADEEAGGMAGAGFLVETRPALFADVGYVLNEGGGGVLASGRPVFSVEVTQKVPLWLRVTASGEPGHGSSPRSSSAVGRLVGALARLERHTFAPRAVPEVEAYFAGLAGAEGGELRARFLDLGAAIDDAVFLRRLQAESPRLHALLRNTCVVTRLGGSPKINVVPAEAWAEIDCRLLPDQDPDEFLHELRAVLADPGLGIEPLMAFAPAISSPDTELFRAIEQTCRAHFPGAAVLPSVVAGFTDSHFFRDLGITAYGFSPTLFAEDEATGIHGNNERISVENLSRGVRVMIDLLERMAY